MIEPERRTIPRRLTALLAFLRSQTAGGLALIAASVFALVWSNASGSAAYFGLMSYRLGILPVDGWVNDGLMALFFLVVGLEIRREMTEGQLSSRRQIAAPALAALGGMVVPALFFVGFNHADPTRMKGWAVPVATDIAFALAALSVLGKRVPVTLKLFLTALAIMDDLGAIGVIALFYTAGLNWTALAGASAVCAGLALLNRAGIRQTWVFGVGGALLWACVLRSGVHPTIAGVALAFVVPMEPVGHGMASRLEGWVTWIVLPLFGLANAGLDLGGVTLADFATPVVLGVGLGLILGKPIGVFGAAWLSVRLGWAHLPAGLSWSALFGAAMLCGIGFTMSLFIGDLGFHGSSIHSEVKLAVFAGSLISAAAGVLFLSFTAKPRRPQHHGSRAS